VKRSKALNLLERFSKDMKETLPRMALRGNPLRPDVPRAQPVRSWLHEISMEEPGWNG
jgi:hypothetical protein